MTDPTADTDDLLARADAFAAEDHDDFDDRYILVADLAAAVRDRDAQLAEAQAVYQQNAAQLAETYGRLHDTERLEARYRLAAERAENELATARDLVTEVAENPPYQAEMYDDPRCCYCRTVVGDGHTDSCLIERARLLLSVAATPTSPEDE